MKIHLCLFKNDQEVININDVCVIIFLDDCIKVNCEYTDFFFRYSEFDYLKVDYYD